MLPLIMLKDKVIVVFEKYVEVIEDCYTSQNMVLPWTQSMKLLGSGKHCSSIIN